MTTYFHFISSTLSNCIPSSNHILNMSNDWIPKFKCAAFNCTLCAVKNIYKEVFCQRHSEELRTIRHNIKKVHSEGNLQMELFWRIKEHEIRGSDLGHAYRIIMLYKKVNEINIYIPPYPVFCRRDDSFQILHLVLHYQCLVI